MLDTFTDRHVAIKMMNKKYSSIGQQEAVRIQSVNEKDKNGEFPGRPEKGTLCMKRECSDTINASV